MPKMKDTFEYLQGSIGKRLEDAEAMEDNVDDNATLPAEPPHSGPIHYLNPEKEDKKHAAKEKKELDRMAKNWGWRDQKKSR